MPHRGKTYRTQQIQITFDPVRCIHAEACVKGLPAVFDPDRKPWIDPDGASASEVAKTVVNCPTGALHFERLDGGAGETAPASNTVTLGINGPLFLRGRIKVVKPGGGVILEDTRVALCRCGASEHKLLCDGTHKKIEFSDDGAIERQLEAVVPPNGELEVTSSLDGPFVLKGPFTLVDAKGAAQPFQHKAALCRCGQSATKPLCDGAHVVIDFKTD